MRHLVRNSIILLALIALAVWAIVPPEKKLRRGKDLAGGVSMTYGVDVKSTDDRSIVNKVISVIKERLDPNGVMDMQIVAQGADRIEITMPLPSERVKQLKREFDDHVASMGGTRVTAEDLSRALALPKDQREIEFKRLAGADAARLSRLEAAGRAYDDYAPEREKFEGAQRALNEIRTQVRQTEATAPSGDPLLEQMRSALSAAEKNLRAEAAGVAPLSVALDDAQAAATAGGFAPSDLSRALTLPTQRLRIPGKNNKVRELPSARERAMAEIRSKHPELKDQIDKSVDLWAKFEAERRGLDDPQDVMRILRGAGVLSFRITVQPNTLPDEQEARQQLRTSGPRSARLDGARWFKINKLESWVSTEEQLDALEKSAAGFFQGLGYVVEEYKGEFFMLCNDSRGMRLTPEDGQWAVSSAFPGSDQLGRVAIDFRMDALGASRLGSLTENNVGKQMAVLLDDQVYTAPTLQSRISSSGQITGNFSPAEREYIIRVLSAGSLKAKLTQDPISVSIMGPQLGQDNLDKGLRAGMIAFVVVGGFMILYYFSNGLVAVIALVINAVLLVGAMALNQAAFTLPGIAGIILTFGMAVDANVLIYERMREEYGRGADLRTAVRLGYSKALSAIVDGNITTLIVCVVLGFTGTQEIKGFAITLGIGVATTLFAQLFATRLIYTLLVEHVRVRKMDMLSTVFPAWQRLITPNFDWMKIRFITLAVSIILTGIGIFFIVYEGVGLMGTEFRGGTSVTIELKSDPATGKAMTLDRHAVEKRVRGLASGLSAEAPLSNMQFAEVLAINPEKDNVTSSTFTIKSLVTDVDVVQSAIVNEFNDVLETRRALNFDGDDQKVLGGNPPVFPINTPALGDSIGMPSVRSLTGEYYGGVTIVLKNITPSVSKAEIQGRVEALRSKSDYSDTLSRLTRVVVLEGTDDAVKSAAVLVRDPAISYFEDETGWQSDVRNREWNLVSEALTSAQTLASAQSFSPAVATTFRNQAIVAVLLSTLLVVMYVWVRFNSIRYSFAAIVTTLHDCLVAVGFVGLATEIYNNAPDLAAALMILPFKIDLNVVAAVLTILGYSLNDTIIVMDRIRENRGRRPGASREVVNHSINQTISRTLITSGTTLVATLVLYIFGGEGVRVFAYTMLIGILVGTYSSIAVAAPLVWDHRMDKGEPIDSPPVEGAAAALPA